MWEGRRVMERVYIICMGIGIGILLVSFIFGQLMDLLDGLFDGVSNVLEGVNLDPSITFGNVSLCILPFSMQSICMGLLVFGAVGLILPKKIAPQVCFVIAIVIAYLAAVLVQTFIKKLKNVENTTYRKEELLLFDTKVVHTIIKGGYGSISISTLDGITTNYPAKAKDPNIEIRQGTQVQVVYFDKNVAIVEEKEKEI